MPLVGIVAKRRDIQKIKKEIKEKNVEIVEITKQSIKNIKNIKFEEIIFLENINLEDNEYKYMNDIILNTKYLILNADIQIDVLKNINLKKSIKIINFGFNTKSTISISSVNDDKIIVYLQREIEKPNGEVLESQEKNIFIKNIKKIHNNILVFIINELNN